MALYQGLLCTEDGHTALRASTALPAKVFAVGVQVVYKVCDDVDLEPLLTEVNAIRQKEKDEES